MRLSLARSRATTRWVLILPRSASGFRLMNMRPRLTEALKRPAPTEEPTPATAGSASTMSMARSCKAFMASKEMSVEAAVPPKISPVSSCGKKPFGTLMNSPTVSAMVAKNTISISARLSSAKCERAVVEADRARQHALDQPVEPGGGLARRLAHEVAADHRRHRQRHHGRHHDGEGERHREFAEQPADDAAHEQQRNEGGEQRDRDRYYGEADLARALQGGAQRRIALLQIAEHVLDHHDGVVDHEADRHHQRHQRQVVDREAGRPHRRAGAGERQRHRDAGGQRRRRAPQEHGHHQHHQQDGGAERELHVVHAGADGLGAVGQHRNVDAGGNPLLELAAAAS